MYVGKQNVKQKGGKGGDRPNGGMFCACTIYWR